MSRAVVTGAFSYTGAAVARELMARGWEVATLTNRIPTSPGPITAAPLRFELGHLVDWLRGADALVSTYWMRLPEAGSTFDDAVANGSLLLRAAAQAGVGRVVQISVSNAAAGRHLGYFDGKARLEEAARSCGVPWAIVRPTMVVGPSDVLTNNIAWFLRRFPLFLLPAGGRALIQPVTLADTGRIVADAVEASGNVELDAAGPDVYSFAGYVRLLARACGVEPWIVSSPPTLALAGLAAVGAVLGDTILAREELQCLLDDLIVSHEPPRGRESVAEWLLANGDEIGRSYLNDRRRHLGRDRSRPILDPGRAKLEGP